MIEEELKVLFPVSRRSDRLFEAKRKRGQSPSDFFLELKDTVMDCQLGSMGEELLLCHLLVRGILPSEVKIREKIIVKAKGGELKNANISALISSAEM